MGYFYRCDHCGKETGARNPDWYWVNRGFGTFEDDEGGSDRERMFCSITCIGLWAKSQGGMTEAAAMRAQYPPNSNKARGSETT